MTDTSAAAQQQAASAVSRDPSRALIRIFTGRLVGQPAMGYLPLNATVAASPPPSATQSAVTVEGFDTTATFACNFETRATGVPAAGTGCVVCFPGNDPQGYGWVIGFKI